MKRASDGPPAHVLRMKVANSFIVGKFVSSLQKLIPIWKMVNIDVARSHRLDTPGLEQEISV